MRVVNDAENPKSNMYVLRVNVPCAQQVATASSQIISKIVVRCGLYSWTENISQNVEREAHLNIALESNNWQ